MGQLGAVNSTCRPQEVSPRCMQTISYPQAFHKSPAAWPPAARWIPAARKMRHERRRAHRFRQERDRAGCFAPVQNDPPRRWQRRFGRLILHHEPWRSSSVADCIGRRARPGDRRALVAGSAFARAPAGWPSCPGGSDHPAEIERTEWPGRHHRPDQGIHRIPERQPGLRAH